MKKNFAIKLLSISILITACKKSNLNGVNPHGTQEETAKASSSDRNMPHEEQQRSREVEGTAGRPSTSSDVSMPKGVLRQENWDLEKINALASVGKTRTAVEAEMGPPSATIPFQGMESAQYHLEVIPSKGRLSLEGFSINYREGVVVEVIPAYVKDIGSPNSRDK